MNYQPHERRKRRTRRNATTLSGMLRVRYNMDTPLRTTAPPQGVRNHYIRQE